MKHDADFIQECRRYIVGKTWLKIQLMQGSSLICHHSKGRHFASIAGRVVTETHESEIGLAEEMLDIHNTPFYDMQCLSSDGDEHYLKTEWRLLCG